MFVGGPKGAGHNLLMQFSSLCSSKMEILIFWEGGLKALLWTHSNTGHIMAVLLQLMYDTKRLVGNERLYGSRCQCQGGNNQSHRGACPRFQLILSQGAWQGPLHGRDGDRHTASGNDEMAAALREAAGLNLWTGTPPPPKKKA